MVSWIILCSKGESCVGCHEEKGALNFDFKRLASKELEPVGAPKTIKFPVTVQAAYDKENFYMRLTFKSPTDAPAGADNSASRPLLTKSSCSCSWPSRSRASIHAEVSSVLKPPLRCRASSQICWNRSRWAWLPPRFSSSAW